MRGSSEGHLTKLSSNCLNQTVLINWDSVTTLPIIDWNVFRKSFLAFFLAVLEKDLELEEVQYGSCIAKTKHWPYVIRQWECAPVRWSAVHSGCCRYTLLTARFLWLCSTNIKMLWFFFTAYTAQFYPRAMLPVVKYSFN